jgi:hypothetical protein
VRRDAGRRWEEVEEGGTIWKERLKRRKIEDEEAWRKRVIRSVGRWWAGMQKEGEYEWRKRARRSDGSGWEGVGEKEWWKWVNNSEGRGWEGVKEENEKIDEESEKRWRKREGRSAGTGKKEWKRRARGVVEEDEKKRRKRVLSRSWGVLTIRRYGTVQYVRRKKHLHMYIL